MVPDITRNEETLADDYTSSLARLMKHKHGALGIVDTSVLRSFVKAREQIREGVLSVQGAWNLELELKRRTLDHLNTVSFPQETSEEYTRLSERLARYLPQENGSYDALDFLWCKKDYRGVMPTDVPYEEGEGVELVQCAFGEFMRFNDYFMNAFSLSPTEQFIDADLYNPDQEHVTLALSDTLLPGQDTRKRSTDLRLFYKALLAARNFPANIITRDRGYIELQKALYERKEDFERASGIPFPRYPVIVTVDSPQKKHPWTSRPSE